jgi:drug/metabolite transporter (DMT)-like permease
MEQITFGAAVQTETATFVGDLFSLFGAISIIGYLHVGRTLREWMPIFLYALPVTAVSAVLSTLLAFVFDGAQLTQTGPRGVFGFFDAKHFGWVLYLACGPGIVGHTGFNTLLRFFPPLVISMAFPLEPIVGSMLGALMGVSSLPGPLTWIGGGIMVRLLP